MWLIDTSTLELKSFASTSSVEYAILSHTWAEEEITFDEFKTPADQEFHILGLRAAELRAHMEQVKELRPRWLRSRAGWPKLEGFCKLSREMGFKFAWMDTCCIDKTSSAELSEAINAMYSWYQDAVLCIVYLSDFRPGMDLETEFRSCRWFKRGWTLQELLAPRALRFFDAGWNVLGGKQRINDPPLDVPDLTDVLSTATGIGLDFLQVPSDACVAQRFSWTVGRATTRAEDAIYCLLGVFGVNMPLLYGEGFHKAFRRLQIEIIQASNDSSLFFWESPSAAPGITPDVLATSLSQFQNAGDVIRDMSQRHPGPYDMTNIGLRMTTEISSRPWYSQSGPKNHFLIQLNCRRSGRKNGLGLLITRTAERADEYSVVSTYDPDNGMEEEWVTEGQTHNIVIQNRLPAPSVQR